MDYAGRMERLRARMKRGRVDALVISHLPNIRYLTGFSGSNALLAASGDEAAFYSDSRYTSQAGAEVAGARVGIPGNGDLLGAAARRLHARLPGAAARMMAAATGCSERRGRLAGKLADSNEAASGAGREAVSHRRPNRSTADGVILSGRAAR